MNPTNEMTVISSAILDSIKNNTKIINHISGTDGDRIILLKCLYIGISAVHKSINDMPDNRLVSSLSTQRGKYEKIATVTGIIEIASPKKPKRSLFVGLFLDGLTRYCLLHFTDPLTDGILLILRQRR